MTNRYGRWPGVPPFFKNTSSILSIHPPYLWSAIGSFRHTDFQPAAGTQKTEVFWLHTHRTPPRIPVLITHPPTGDGISTITVSLLARLHPRIPCGSLCRIMYQIRILLSSLCPSSRRIRYGSGFRRTALSSDSLRFSPGQDRVSSALQ